ncbi:hypothetical protein NQ314_000282 [Rhamnusium bicolor]|uniref:Uncharacterized protein n=1 Tax=Rhamnusium bicolor TaxID=1586634 RepID=A0AAV8ZVB0_9CUCU|nr:hypothetical protein NQ314_000282 [Rhamnusium bicolor]
MKYPGCVPKTCGRYVSDKIVTTHEAETLLQLAHKGMNLKHTIMSMSTKFNQEFNLTFKNNILAFIQIEL